MTIALYSYKPDDVYALKILANKEAKTEAQTYYIGSALWGILQYSSGGNSTLPPWGKVFGINPEEKTGREIVDDLASKLRSNIEKRRRKTK